MSEGLSRFSNYEQPQQSVHDHEAVVEGSPSAESIEAAEQALELHAQIEEQFGEREYFGEEAREGTALMNELSQLLSDRDARTVFDVKLHQQRLAENWVPPSERVAA